MITSIRKQSLLVFLRIWGCTCQIAKVLTVGKINYIERVQRMGEDRSYPHAEAKKDFNYNPMSFEEGIQIEVNQYLKK